MKLKILTDLFFSLPMVRSTPRQIPASVFVATRLPPSELRDVAMVSAVCSSPSSMQVASRPSRLSRHFAPIVLAVMATALSACSGGDGPSLINDGGEQILPAGQTMAPLVLANSNDDYQISFCRSEPALPAGMSVAVDSENNACTISGTPTAVEVASTYRIIAVAISVAEGSSSSDEIDVSISVTLANGTELSGQATLSAQRGTAASAGSGWSFAGTFFGGSGDESDSDEGESESTDSDSDEDESTESESEDGDQSALTGPAPDLRFTDTPVEFVAGVSASFDFTNNGGAPTSCLYAGNSDLPPAGLVLGLSADGTTCRISGIATTSAELTAYYILAANDLGISAALIHLAVSAPPPVLPIVDPTAERSLAAVVVDLMLGASVNFALPDERFSGQPFASDYIRTLTCTASPSLPAGLSIVNASSLLGCEIVGVPQTLAGWTSYLITAEGIYPLNGASFQATVEVDLRVRAAGTTPGQAATRTPQLVQPAAPIEVTLGSQEQIVMGNTGGAPTQCDSQTSLPTGLAIDISVDGFTCAIVGTVSDADVAYYANNPLTVIATNAIGSSQVTVNITVVVPPPARVPPVLGFLGGLCVLAVGEYYEIELPGGDQLFFPNGGGNPSGYANTVQSCATTPLLPAGLQVVPNSAKDTCVILGTPEVAIAATTYTVTATNAAGTGEGGVEIIVYPSVSTAVNVAAPALQATADLLDVALGSEVYAIYTNVGGLPDSCTVSPALPSGLEVILSPDLTTCIIIGSPTNVDDAHYTPNIYTVNAVNAGGSSETDITISILPPPRISDLPGLCELTVGEHYEIEMPNRTYPFFDNNFVRNYFNDRPAGAVQSCASAPALPAGLQVTPHPTRDTCLISGTPEVASIESTYAITATNASGSVVGGLAIVVYPSATVAAPVLQAAPDLINVALVRDVNAVFANTGGLPQTCTVRPALPNGLTVSLSDNDATCVITGAPRDVSDADYARNTYTVVAENAGGRSRANIIISILPPPIIYGLSGLCELTVGEYYEIMMPDRDYYGSFIFNNDNQRPAGAVQSCASAPALPAGLQVTPHPTRDTCLISGTPEAPSAEATFTITATNASGADDGHVDIVVYPSVTVAAPVLQDAAELVDVALGSEVYAAFTNTGGLPETCTVSPALPNGLAVVLSEDEATCIITGAPRDIGGFQYYRNIYTVYTLNAGGHSYANIIISILPPPALFDLDGLCELTVGEHYEILMPSQYLYGSFLARYFYDSPVGAVQSCASSPPLPAGLRVTPHPTLDTCVISGTPEEPSAEATYTITAANASGADDGHVAIVVYPSVPAPALQAATDLVDVALVRDVNAVFTNTGGLPETCTVSPALPNGLTVSLSDNDATCVITGAPRDVSDADYARNTYTVVAENAGGRSRANIIISILPPPIIYGLSGLCELTVGEYYEIVMPDRDYYNSFIFNSDNQRPAGAVRSCASSPPLPAGLQVTPHPILDTCLISGTPEEPSAEATYTITAANASGADDGYVDIVVYPSVPAPALQVATDLIDVALGSDVYAVFTNTGGLPQTCTVSPTLPAGLAVVLSDNEATCIITGSPTDVDDAHYAQSTYTVTAANEGGHSRADISISILPLPRLFNLVGLCELTVGEYYEIVIPGYQGGTVNLVGGGRYYVSEPSGYPQSCASAPSLPAGLRVAPHSTLDTCVISGTPEEPSAEATYTITAANASGADDGSVDIVVYPLVAAPALADLPDQIIAVGQEIDLTFANTGDAPAAETGCAVRPTLPAGMAVAVADDGSTCTITGVSTAASASVIYTVTATNTAGSSDASVSIRIDADTASTAVRIAQVSAGLEHTCAISEGGQLYCWGINYDHQLGLGIDEANYMRPVLVGTDSDWATVSAGYNGTCAVKTDGSLYCWGILRRELNLSSQLGSEPTRIGDSYDWVDVEINTRVCALKSSGQLFCWGLGEYGVLGNGDSASRSEPTLVGNTPESGWSGMNFGTDSACAIDADEQLYCWGKSVYRLLTNEIERGIRYVPTAIGDLSWSAVATEDSAICAISTEGRLYCWGYSERGGLGNGVDGRSTLTEPTQVGQAENWRQISTGHQNACAVNEQNQLYCWGFGRFGALGLGDEANRTTPTRVGVRNDWAQVSFGSDHVCAVNLSAELYCWGIGYAGALGVGDTDGRLEPALVLIDSTEPVVDGSGPDNNGDGNNPDTTPTGDPDDDANNPDTTPTGDPDDVADETTEPAPAQFVQISTGSNYTCAVDGDGDLNCWGPGVAIGFSSLFGGYYPAPTTVALGEGMNWASVSAGGALVCAITTEGALYCWEVHPCPLLSWGFSDASLGSGPFRGAYMVAQSNWSQVSAGKLHACAINSDDELHCWGDGSGGRLGTVDNTPGRVGANYTWADVSAGVGHTCASNTQGELYCWGRGDDGQLGLNDNTNYSTPRRVGADTDWADISVGSYHSCAVKSSGQLFCWGSDDSDQLGLGQGNLNNAAYPTRVGSGENWATVSSGARHTCALTDASEYYCWGTGPVNRYFFATSTTIDWHRPVLMSNRADWTQITGGNSMLCALNTRGYAYCSRPFFYSITSTAPINEVDNFDFFPDPARRTN